MLTTSSNNDNSNNDNHNSNDNNDIDNDNENNQGNFSDVYFGQYTFQQNFDRLAEVVADGGRGLDRAVARRRARRARRESGCSANGVRTGVAEPPRRVVGGTAS